MAPTDKDARGRPLLPDCGDVIQSDTFEQILEMDDEDDREFSHELVFGFFDQSSQTLNELAEALKAKDLKTLSDLGHYLKGSSATLGLTRVRDHCEKIQHLGSSKNEVGDPVKWDDEVILKKIKAILEQLKTDCADVETRLRNFYRNFPAPNA